MPSSALSSSARSGSRRGAPPPPPPAARGGSRVRAAIAHPCDEVAIESAVEGALLGLIEPVLVGPEARIREAAERFDIASCEISDAEHSHDSAAKAVAEVRAGRAGALMKGSLHTDEFMAAVV